MCICNTKPIEIERIYIDIDSVSRVYSARIKDLSALDNENNDIKVEKNYWLSKAK